MKFLSLSGVYKDFHLPLKELLQGVNPFKGNDKKKILLLRQLGSSPRASCLAIKVW